eukprot:evm.model.scf_67.3 EVM.evm.TU.scf_67.3   scf_67:31271-34499(+)
MKAGAKAFVFVLVAALAVVSGAKREKRKLNQDEPEFCVVINEVVNKPEDIGDTKGVDFLELKNDCEQSIDMTGWVISDEDGKEFVMGAEGCEGKHVIDANGYFVFFRESDCSFTFGFTKNDKATLKDGTGLVMDETEWSEGDADKGFSWSRIPDGSGPFQTSLPTAGVQNVAA